MLKIVLLLTWCVLHKDMCITTNHPKEKVAGIVCANADSALAYDTFRRGNWRFAFPEDAEEHVRFTRRYPHLSCVHVFGTIDYTAPVQELEARTLATITFHRIDRCDGPTTTCEQKQFYVIIDP